MRGILVSVLTLIIFGSTAILLWLRERKRVDKVVGELDTYYEMLKEKRKSVRFPKRLNVVCKVIERADSQWAVYSKDISGEGICLYLPEILPQDGVVDLEIQIPEGKNIPMRGKVVWVKEVDSAGQEGKRQFNAGIKFVKIKPDDKNMLMDYIRRGL